MDNGKSPKTQQFCMSRVVLQEEPAPSFLKLSSDSTNSFNQTRLHFHIIVFIHLQIWWDKLCVNNSLTVQECAQNDFYIFDFRIWNFFFFCHGGLSEPYSILGLFVWGSYWKHQVSIGSAIGSSKEWLSSIDWINYWQVCSLRVFCSSGKQRGTNPMLLSVLWDFPLKFCQSFPS
jgi:hypothetical protein